MSVAVDVLPTRFQGADDSGVSMQGLKIFVALHFHRNLTKIE
jgi:hypothetical protein